MGCTSSTTDGYTSGRMEKRMHAAADIGDTKRVETLLMKCRKWLTTQEAEERHTEYINRILNFSDNPKGHTVLHAACEKGHDNVVLLLLQDKVSEFLRANQLDSSGRTALFLGCENGHERIVRALLAWGGDSKRVDARVGVLVDWSKPQTMPLHVACEGGRVDIVALLLPHYRGNHLNAPSAQGKGFTPLLLAMRGEHYAIVEMLLRTEGIEVNLFSIIAIGGISTQMKLFVLQHPLVDVHTRAKDDERTILHVVCGTGCRQAIRALLKRGADPTLEDLNGRNCMYEACSADTQDSWQYFGDIFTIHTEAVRLLLRARRGSQRRATSIVDGAARDGRMPLHQVANARAYCVDIVRAFLLLHDGTEGGKGSPKCQQRGRRCVWLRRRRPAWWIGLI